MIKGAVCQTCVFFEPYKYPKQGQVIGHCKFWPSVAHVDVTKNNWCGQYKPDAELVKKQKDALASTKKPAAIDEEDFLGLESTDESTRDSK